LYAVFLLCKLVCVALLMLDPKCTSSQWYAFRSFSNLIECIYFL